ncbi:MAG: DMT family transporter [Gemmatimonadales bacterium]
MLGSPSPDARTRRTAYLALAAAACLWGTGFPLGKIALEQMTVGEMVLYRFLFACIGLLPLLLRRRLTAPRSRDLPLFLAAGALYVPVQFLIQFEGLARTTVSHASLMVGMLPILLAVGAVTFTHERLDVVGWLTLFASTLGAALIVMGAGAAGRPAAGGATLIGDLLVLVSLLAAVGWVLVSQRLMGDGGGYPPVIASVYVLVIGTALLAVWQLGRHGMPAVRFSATVWIAVAAQGLFATALTTVLWNRGLAQVAAARAGVFVNLEPVVGAILGVSLLGETLGPMALAGGVLIVGSAVAFTVRGGARRRASSSPVAEH